MNKNNKFLQESIKKYNAISLIYPSKFLPNNIVWDEVSNLETVFWKNYWRKEDTDFLIPIAIKRKCVELYQMNNRSIEEISMVKNEMTNVLNFYKAKINKFKHGVLLLENSFEDEGWKALLLKEINSLDGKLYSLSDGFSSYLNSDTSIDTNILLVDEDCLSTDSDESDIDLHIDF